MARPRRPAGPWLVAAAAFSTVLLALDVLAAAPLGAWSAASRAALAPTCHQRPERSFALDGAPLGACARCTGLHASGLLALAAAALASRRYPSRSAWGRAAAVAAAALAADVAAGLLVPGWDEPWLRAATGLACGVTLLGWGAAWADEERPCAAGAPA